MDNYPLTWYWACILFFLILIFLFLVIQRKVNWPHPFRREMDNYPSTWYWASILSFLIWTFLFLVIQRKVKNQSLTKKACRPHNKSIYFEEKESLVHDGVANSCWEGTVASLVHGYHKILDKVIVYPFFVRHIKPIQYVVHYFTFLT